LNIAISGCFGLVQISSLPTGVLFRSRFVLYSFGSYGISRAALRSHAARM
jgi:hypothetical protein